MSLVLPVEYYCSSCCCCCCCYAAGAATTPRGMRSATYNQHQQQRQQLGAAAAAAYVDIEPWLQPCGTPVASALAKFPQRHSVHRALKRVKTQFRVAQNQFRTDLKDIHDIYSKVYKVLKEQYRMNWLPEKQLEWYHREIWCLDKSKKAEQALPRLHDALQRFAITFHHLRIFRLKSNINVDFTMIRRNSIIDGMKSEILRMLCEVETAILNLGLQLPKTLKSVLVTESSSWAREGDLTLMLIQDSGVLRLYQTFLNDWIRALRNATAIGPGTCDPAQLRPLTSSSHAKSKRFQKKQQKQQRRASEAAAAAGKRNHKRKIKKLKSKFQTYKKKKILAQGRRKISRKKKTQLRD